MVFMVSKVCENTTRKPWKVEILLVLSLFNIHYIWIFIRPKAANGQVKYTNIYTLRITWINGIIKGTIWAVNINIDTFTHRVNMNIWTYVHSAVLPTHHVRGGVSLRQQNDIVLMHSSVVVHVVVSFHLTRRRSKLSAAQPTKNCLRI